MDGKKALVVDDEAEAAKLISDILESMGYQVRTASSAEEALPFCIRENFDVIITDFNMGGMHGVAMAREIVEGLRKRPRIILVTGSEISKEEAGPHIFRVICKPYVGIDVLRAAIEDSQ